MKQNQNKQKSGHGKCLIAEVGNEKTLGRTSSNTHLKRGQKFGSMNLWWLDGREKKSNTRERKASIFEEKPLVDRLKSCC